MQIIQSVVRDLEGNQLKKQEQLLIPSPRSPLAPRHLGRSTKRLQRRSANGGENQNKTKQCFWFSLSRLVQSTAKVKGRAQRIFLSIFRMDFPFLFAEGISLLLFLQFCPFQ